MSAGGDNPPDTDRATLLDGRLSLIQPRRGHRAGTDALLLAALAATEPFRQAVDLGAGVGTVGLVLAHAVPDATITLVERDAALVRLAALNAEANGYASRVRATAADVSDARALGLAGLAGGSADLVVANPPFHDSVRHRASPDPDRAGAHAELPALLEAWLATAFRLLRPGARCVLIHRADAIDRLAGAMAGRFGALSFRFVHPAAGRPAHRVLIAGRKGRKTAAEVGPPLFLHEADGRFTPAAEALHRTGAWPV